MRKALYSAIFILLWIMISGCNKTPEIQNDESLNHANVQKNYQYASYKDIPGVTDREIEDIEALRKQVDSFVYVTMSGTEAFIDEAGQMKGWSALFCQWLTDLFDIEFKPQFTAWPQYIPALSTYADFAGQIPASDEWRKNLMMTTATATQTVRAFRHINSLPDEYIAKTRPLKYGFVRNTTTTINAVLSKLEPGTFETILLANTNEAVKMLRSGEIDVFFTSNMAESAFDEYADITAENFFPFVFLQVSLAAQKKELEPFISVVQKALDDGAMRHLTALYNQGYKEYQKHKLLAKLTEEELLYIKEHNTVLFAAEYDNYPASFYNEHDNEWQGSAHDVLNEISLLTGISFKQANDDKMNFSELLNMVEKGDAALLTEIIQIPEREGIFIWPQSSIIPDNYVLISKSHFPNVKANEILYTRVGLIKYYAHSAMFRNWFPNHEKIAEYENVFAAFDALDRDEVDIVMGSQNLLLLLTNYFEQAGFKINFKFEASYASTLGINKDEVILCSIINKALRLIDIDGISYKWRNQSYDYRIKIAEMNRPWQVGVAYLAVFSAVLTIMLVFLVILFIKNKNAHTLNKSQTNEIDRQNKLLFTVNSISSVLLEPDMSSFEDTLQKSLRQMVQAVGVDRICIWKNSSVDERLRITLVYQLEDNKFTSFANNGLLAPDFWFDEHPAWNNMITKGDCIKSLVSDMSPSEQAELVPRKIQSILIVPIFLHDQFWGVVGFDYCKVNKVFEDSEVLILRSASRMLVNAVIRNEMSESLVAAKNSAEQSNLSKSIFLSQMSHEIRTPMNAILGIAEIHLRDENLQQGTDGDVTSSTQKAFGRIYESGDLLLNIINDILDLSKIEAGKLELSHVRYDIPSLINDTAQLNRMRYDSKPVEFSIEVDENMPIDLFGDELRIKQVLNNVLSNAFKYTDEGKIEFAVSAELEKEDMVMLTFRVSDTGQGMTEDQVSRLFDEYSRFNMETNRTIVGAGLGMSITKRLVDLMNGSITVQSEPGKGSVVTVRIPQKLAGSSLCGSETAAKLRNFNFSSTTLTNKTQFIREYMPYGSVLVVDDVESNIYVAKGMLLPYGIKIDTASSGFEAIKKIEDGNIYDIVFMDHMMPKMDGIEATKRIRKMGYTHTIVALTANALAGRADMFLQNGFDAFISKPIDSRELNLKLNELIRNKQPPEVIEAARRESSHLIGAAQNKPVSVQKKNISDELVTAAVHDIENAIAVLEELLPGINSTNADMGLYNTTVHGIKSALANVGEMTLSAAALRLEHASEDNAETSVISNETRGFINSLRSFLEKLKSTRETRSSGLAANQAESTDISEEDKVFLRNKLNEINSACEKLNLNAAKTALNELKQKTWPGKINDSLNEISIYLIRGECKNVVSVVDGIADLFPEGE